MRTAAVIAVTEGWFVSDRVLAIGPRSPPITGPGLKNKYIQQGLENHGLEVHWVNTLEQRPRTVFDILRNALTYDAYILSASTKVRLCIAPVLAPKLRSPAVNGALFPAGGEFAEELASLPASVREFYVRTFSLFDGIYPQTDALAGKLQRLFGQGTAIRTVPNLRPIPKTSPVRDSDREPQDRPLRLAYVGRVKASKGLDDLLEAFSTVRERGVNAVLDIYGHFLPNDSYRESFLETCSHTAGVSFRGKLPNEAVIPTLRDADVFVFPTVYDGEGFPGVLVEAFAAGCPVIATDWNYNGDIVTPTVDGLLYDPHDVETLAGHIERLATDAETLESMQHNAYRTAKSYSVERVSDRIVDYLTEAGWTFSRSVH